MRFGRAMGLLVATLLPVTLGCNVDLPFLRFGGGEEPVLVGVVTNRSLTAGDNPIELLNPLGPYEPMREALEQESGRPVRLDLCLQPLLEPCLNDGHYELAVLTTAQYVELPNAEEFAMLAVSTDGQGRPARSALLVVSATSPVQRIADLKGKRVAFGLQRNARSHAAGLLLLSENGVSTADLSLEVLPLPGSLKTFPKSKDVMQSVINGSSDAGFVDAADWEQLPGTARRGGPTRDRLRVIGRTVELPDLVIIASPKFDAEARTRLSAALVNLGEKHPQAARSLDIAGFAVADEDVQEACLKLRGKAPREAAAHAKPGT